MSARACRLARGRYFFVVFALRVAVFVADEHPFAVFVEQKEFEGPAPVRVSYPPLTQELVIVMIYSEVPVLPRHVEQRVLRLLAVGDEAGERRGVGQDAAVLPVYQDRPVVRDDDVEGQQVVMAERPRNGAVGPHKQRIGLLQQRVFQELPAPFTVAQALVEAVATGHKLPALPGPRLKRDERVQGQRQSGAVAAAQVFPFRIFHEEVGPLSVCDSLIYVRDTALV